MIKSTVKYFDCQKRGIDFISKNHYALLAFEQGLGKTLTSLSHRDLASNTKVLVVCPAYLTFNWADEIKQHTTFDLKNFKICSYEYMTKNIFELIDSNFEYVIFDESHYLKSITAKRTKAAYHLVLNSKPKNVVLLTGTPAKNKLESLWSQLKIISLGRPIKNFPKGLEDFKSEFIEYQRIEYGASLVVFKEIGVKNTPQLIELLKSAALIEKVDKNLDLPESQVSMLSLKNSKVDKILHRIFEESRDDLKNLEKDHISSFKRDTAILKSKLTVQFIKDFVENNPDKSLVVFSCHPSAVKEIASGLKNNSYFEVNQSMGPEERNEVKNKFQEGKRKILIATIGTFSTGVTLTRSHHMIFNDYPWDVDDLKQAMSRIRRIGQTMTCFYYYVVSGDLDKHILKTISLKNKIKSTVGL